MKLKAQFLCTDYQKKRKGNRKTSVRRPFRTRYVTKCNWKPCLKLSNTVNPEYFACTEFSYAGDLPPFVRMKFLYSRWPLRILWLALNFWHAFYFCTEPPRTKYTKVKCMRKILDLQYKAKSILVCRAAKEFVPLRRYSLALHRLSSVEGHTSYHRNRAHRLGRICMLSGQW